VDRVNVEVSGGPLDFHRVQDILEREGIEIHGDMPQEERGGGVPRELVWIFVAIGLDDAWDAAKAQLREKWPHIRIRIRRDDKD
jgi:hypothetical protein